jgi:hypothetical protein
MLLDLVWTVGLDGLREERSYEVYAVRHSLRNTGIGFQ